MKEPTQRRQISFLLFLLINCLSGRVKQDFFSLVEQQYGVRPKSLQGGNRDMKEINDWVSRETGGKVQRLLAKPIPQNSGVNTVSAAYFKGTSSRQLVRRFNREPAEDA